MERPTAAQGKFPYPHRNLAEVWGQQPAHAKGDRNAALIELYLSGKTTDQCAAAFHISRERARSILIANGITRRRCGPRK